MNIHPTGSRLLRILRLRARGCTATGYKNCNTLIQKHRFETLRKQNGLSCHLRNCMGLTLIRFQYSERIHQIPSEAEDVNNCDRDTKDSSVLSDPSISSSAKGTSSQYRGPTSEGSSTEWKNTSPTEMRTSWEQFCNELQQCTSPSDVLDLYGQSKMAWKYTSNALTTMWETIKRMSDDQRHYEQKLMFEHPLFEKICQKALKEAQLMSCNDLVYSLFALVKMGVTQHSRLIQTLLRVSQERLNGFDERALSVLSSCLRNMEESKNVFALRAGLRLLIELRIPQIKTVVALQTIMRCIGKESSMPLKKKLEDKALSLLNQFTLPNLQYMFITLAVMGYRSYPLLDSCSSSIVENIHGIPFWRLVHILQSCKDLKYRNHALLTAAGNHVASMLSVWEVKQLTLLLVLFAELSFRHIKLMDGFAEMVMARSESLNSKQVLSTLRVFSLLNHRPGEERVEQFLQTLVDLFQSHLSRYSSLELLRGVYYLCFMGHYLPAALNQLFQNDILNDLQCPDHLNRVSNAQMLQYIKLGVELDNPSFAMSESATIADPILPSIAVNSAVKETVEAILGDSSLYRCGSVLRNIHFIDFEIALDQERKIAVLFPRDDDEIVHVTNMQRVAVICAPASAFCLGSVHPKDRLALKVRHLKALGYQVVLVAEHEFGKLSEDERVVFLKNAIFGE
ncbi:FAST kinase domain-containing protein 2, mitochondrial [Rhinoraja longicauda]